MLNNILRYAGGIILGLIIGYLAGDALTRPYSINRQIILKPVQQVNIEPSIVNPDPDKLQYYVDELNKYRTLPGTISVSNNTIYAGLYRRAWSAAYSMPIQHHSVSVYVGQVFGLTYSYKLNSWLGIGAGIFSSGLSAGFSVYF